MDDKEFFKGRDAQRFEEFQAEKERIVSVLSANGVPVQLAESAGKTILEECRKQQEIVDDILDSEVVKRMYTFEDGLLIDDKGNTLRCLGGITLIRKLDWNNLRSFKIFGTSSFDTQRCVNWIKEETKLLYGLLLSFERGVDPADAVRDLGRQIQRRRDDAVNKLIDSALDIEDPNFDPENE